MSIIQFVGGNAAPNAIAVKGNLHRKIPIDDDGITLAFVPKF